MAQYEMNLRDYWLIVRRRRMIIAVTTVGLVLFSFWFAKQKVPLYEATAAVKFEQSAQLSGLLVEVLSYTTADTIETQVGIIKSYPVLEQVARRLGRLPASVSGEALREAKAYWAALDAISRKVRVTRLPNTSILEIAVRSTDPREARDIANAVTEAYRDYNRGLRNARVSEARKFIEAQLREVEGRVRRAEAEVWAFREANRIISPGAESTVLLSLFTQVRGDIERTRQQRTELELLQARLLRADPGGNGRIYIDTPNPALQKLLAAHSELLLERNNLALEVTPQHPRLRALDDRIREVRAGIRHEVAAQIAALRTREEILARQLGELYQRNREVPQVELSLQRLQREAKTNDDLLALLKARHQEALIKESEKIEEVTIVRPATEPEAPIGGEVVNTVLVGALLGLTLGLILAFVQETLDTSIGTIEDVEAYLEVPVLGVIPHISARENMQRLLERRPNLAQMDPDALLSHALLVTHFDPKSPVAEAYRTLRTNVQFARIERAGRVLVVTSPTLQEGKTTTIVNLAITMAQGGQRTLLIGANLRRPSIHRFFGIDREPGLSNILVGSVPWRDCIRTVADILMGRFEMEDIMAAPGLDNLHIIEAGPIPANPSELLSTPAMAAFLREVRDEYDIVLVDTPPILPVTDSAIVASQVDGVILVYQAGKIGRLVLKRAKVHIENVGGKVWGVVLNDVKTEVAGYAYTHYYTHYYGEEPARDQPRRRGLLGRLSGRRPAPAATATAEAPAPAPPRWARLRRWLGLVALAAVILAAAAAVLWALGWLAPEISPRELLRQRLSGPAGLAPPVMRALVPPTAAPAPTPAPPPAGPATAAPAPAVAAPPLPAAPAPAAPEVAAPAAKPAVPPRATARYALEFGPFVTPAEAERVERELGQAGYPTARFRQETGADVYAVLIERLAGAAEARALLARLRAEGFPEAVLVEGAGSPSVRLGPLLPLRGAVRLAERARAAGHAVRVAARPGEALMFVVRHGNFANREEAAARAREVRRLGLPGQIVRVR